MFEDDRTFGLDEESSELDQLQVNDEEQQKSGC